MKRLVVGVLAHVDSGKTTLSEALLYRAGSIRKLGRVDHRDAFLDTDALEKARGITIFAKQAVLTLPAGTVMGTPLEETQITLLDTPGHVAEVTTALAQRGINIATMQLYRSTAGGYAVMVLECDQPLPDALIAELRGMQGIVKVTGLNLAQQTETKEGA